MGKYGFSVYIGGISDRVRTGDVEDFLKGYGKILDISLKSKYGENVQELISIVKTIASTSCNQYLGFIEFEDKYDAEDAVKDLDDKRLCGERVKLEMSKVISS